MNDVITLIGQLRDGDEAAFEKIYKLYFARVFHFAKIIVKNEDLASDVVQEVFVKVWNNRRLIDVRRSFEALLFSMTKNRAIGVLQEASRHKHILEKIVKSATLADRTSQPELLAISHDFYEHAAHTLSGRERTVFELCKIEGYSHEEVAKRLHITKAGVNFHINKALNMLKKVYRAG